MPPSTAPKGRPAVPSVLPAKKSRKPVKNKVDPSLTTYVKRVLKQVHPDTRISSQAIYMVEELDQYLITSIMNVVTTLMAHDPAEKKTCSAREIQTAVRLILPGEIQKHAISEGTKAVTTYMVRHGKKVPGQKTSISISASLVFPVARVETAMRARGVNRLSATAPIYLAAVLEYVSAEILELSGNVARNDKRVTITSRMVMKAIKSDDELDATFKMCRLGGGVLVTKSEE